MSSTLKVQVTNDDGTVIIKLIGEARLDVEDAAFQLNRVVVHHPTAIIVDASELSFLSSIGMSLLVNLRRAVHKAGGIVKLVGLRPMVKGAIAHAYLLELFELSPDLATALAPHRKATDTPPRNTPLTAPAVASASQS